VRKILEISTTEVYNRTGLVFRTNPNLEWLRAALNEAQIEFLKNKKYSVRPHPKMHRLSTIELFVDETTVDSCEWSMLYLLFNYHRN
jgi:hypothetical protein